MEKHRWWGGRDPPSPWRPRGALLPTPPAPRSRGCTRRVRGARLTPPSRRDGQVFPPRVRPPPERRHQPRGRLWPRLPASQTLCFFPSDSMAGLQFKHGQEHARPGPCRAVLPLSPPLPPALSPPEIQSAFYKAAKERSFQPRPQDASVKVKPQPARVVLLNHTSQRRANLRDGQFVRGHCQR